MDANVKQSLVAVSVMLYLLAGVPVWWQMTKIHRPALPKDEIHRAGTILDSREEQQIVVNLLIHSFLPKIKSGLDVELQVERGVGEIQLGFLKVHLKTKLVEYGPSEANYLLYGEDPEALTSLSLEDMASKIRSCFLAKDHNAYHLVILPHSLREKDECVVHGHVSWITTREPSVSLCSSEVIRVSVSLMREIYFQPFVPPSQAVKSAVDAKQDEAVDMAESMLVASSKLSFVFTLCNSDASNGFWLWDFQQLQNAWLSGTLNQLRQFLNIHIESQVIFDCDITVNLTMDEDLHSFILHEEDTPFFMSSAWDVDPSGKVTSGVESDTVAPHVLHFVVYIPPQNKHPLTIVSNNGTPSQSFSLSSWGGLFILNKEYTLSRSQVSRRADLTETDHQEIAQAALSQLRVLLGLTAIPAAHEGDIVRFRSLHEAFTHDEIENLMLTKFLRDLESCIEILSALDRLVDAIPNLEIPNLIQNQTLESLRAFDAALEMIYSGDIAAAVFHSNVARHLAEEAFSHPSIVSKENFPEEHKLGIYLPLFFPILLSILVTSITQFQRVLHPN